MSTSTQTFSTIAADFLRIDADRNATLHAAVVLFGSSVTYDAFQAAANEIKAAYKAKKIGATDNAANVFFARFLKAVQNYADEAGFEITWEKPKSTSAEAVKKAAQRALPEAVQNAKTIADLDAIPMPSDALEAAKLAKAIADTKVRMLKLQSKEAEKQIDANLKARREALIAYIKGATAEQLAELEAMKEHNAQIVIAALPLPDVQSATNAAIKAAKAAAKLAKETEAPL